MPRSIWRSAGYWLLVALSAWFLVAGLLFWGRTDAGTAGILAELGAGVPWWHLGVPLFGFVCLLLLLRNLPGTYWGLLVLDIPFALYALGVNSSFGDLRRLAWQPSLGSVMLLGVVGLHGLLVIALALKSDAVPLTSPFAPLAYLGRAAHLQEIVSFAARRGWQARRPERDGQTLEIRGLWDGRSVTVRSVLRNKLPAGIVLEVTLVSTRRLWPFLLSTSGVEPAAPCLNTSLRGRVAGPSGRGLSFYVWPPVAEDVPDGARTAVAKALTLGTTFLRPQTSIYARAHALVFERSSPWRMTEDGEQLARLIDWLGKMVETLEETGLSDAVDVVYRLVWFELQVTPFQLRFAIVPGQPVIFMDNQRTATEGRTAVIDYASHTALVERLIEGVDALIQRHGILETRLHDPDRAFARTPMSTSGIHIRLGYSDDRDWRSYYAPGEMPPNVRAFVERVRGLAHDLLGEAIRQTPLGLPGSARLAAQPSDPVPPAVTARVKVDARGRLYLNGRPVDIEHLAVTLAYVKELSGVLWYYREPLDPDVQPPPVLGKAAALGIPVWLAPLDFDEEKARLQNGDRVRV